MCDSHHVTKSWIKYQLQVSSRLIVCWNLHCCAGVPVGTKVEDSLVPRLFPPPVFDRLRYANTEGEGLGDLVTCGTSGRQMVDIIMVDTWGAVPDSSNSRFVSNRPWCTMNDGWYWLCLANALASSPRTDSTRKGFEIPCWAPPPVCLPSVYLT